MSERSELFDIFADWIVGNEGRTTTDESFGLDHGLDLLDGWFIRHDARIRAEAVSER